MSVISPNEKPSRSYSAFSSAQGEIRSVAQSESRNRSKSARVISVLVNDLANDDDDENDDFEERRPRGSRSIPLADIPTDILNARSAIDLRRRSATSDRRYQRRADDRRSRASSLTARPNFRFRNQVSATNELAKKVEFSSSYDLKSDQTATASEERISASHVTDVDGRRRGFAARLLRGRLEKLRFLLTCLRPIIELLRRLRSFLRTRICGRKKAVGSQYRTVIPNHVLPDKGVNTKTNPNCRYSGNKIKTTKYTVFTFLPKNMFEQFHRFANLYFVFIVFLNWFPQIEAFGKELSMIPVLFVLAVTAIKDIYEDRRRYQSDQKINHSMCRVYCKDSDRYVRLEWKRILVGDIVHLSCNEIIPADILLLHSSDSAGICFVETSNLDGESNLKQRQGIGTLLGKETFHPTDFRSTVECESPNNQLYKFNGFLLHSDGTREAVNRNNLLLRGCEIRNTDFVEGIVVYAGHETKAMLNNSGPRYKRSKLERLMNWDIIWCVVILLILCFIGAVGNCMWLNSFPTLLDVVAFLPYTANQNKKISPAYEAFLVFWSYIIVLQVMIPISLYVSIEIVKLGQIFFITQDKQLCYANKRIQCRALNIPEELGQIQYVMCDKTGTLTENRMIFRRCTVAGADYGSTEINSSKEQTDYGSNVNANETCKDVQPNRHLQKLLLKVCNEMEDKRLSVPATAKKQAILDFFINMAICNTVVVNPHPHKDSMNSNGTIASEVLPRLANAAHGPERTVPAWNDGEFHVTIDRSSLDNSNFALGVPKSVLRIESIGSRDYAYSVKDANAYSNGAKQSSLPPAEDQPKKATVESSVAPESKVHFEVPTIVFKGGSNGRGSDFRTQSSAIRRMSQSVPLFNESEIRELSLNQAQESNQPCLQEQVDKLRHTLTSEPDLISKTEENGGNITARYAVWFKAANLGKFLHDLPPLMAKLKLPPLNLTFRKTPSTDLSPAGYKNPFYEAESPDELALVYAAAAYGVKLVKRQTGHVNIEMPDGHLLRYKLLHVLPFDSVRKRMSVVVQEPKNDHILLLVKGADTSIVDLLSEEYCKTEHGQAYYAKAMEYTNFYASHGLRTLWLAKKELNPADYASWAEEHAEAEMSLDEREELLFESAVRLERDLDLCGVTGIEDRLQGGVAECIDSLRRGGLKVWVLTGDKIETAVNIAYACKLFVYGMELIQLSARTEEDALTLLQYHIDHFPVKNDHSVDEASCSSTLYPNLMNGLGLVIDGRTLSLCLSAACEDKFVQIITRCTSVLCCRATPLQKAAVVRLVKRRLNGMTLAIGDGANDVSMIQCADVGVGISGQEGMQAVMASDFAMARFRFLHRLLFVHGHWCYDRISRLVCYFFYKNALFVFTSFWFQIWNGFSAQIMIDPLYLMLYNLVFTSLSPILMGVFDQDVSDRVLLANPRLYLLGSTGQLYTWHSFWLNILDAFWQSVVVFYVPFYILFDSNVELWTFGFFITSCLVIVNQLHLAMQVKSWTIPMALSIIISIGIFFAFALGYNALSLTCCAPDAPYFVAENSMRSPLFWLCLLFVTVICLIPRFVFRIIQTTVQPSPVFLAQMRWRARHAKAESVDPPKKHKPFQWISRFNRKSKAVSFEVGTIKSLDLPNSPNNLTDR